MNAGDVGGRMKMAGIDFIEGLWRAVDGILVIRKSHDGRDTAIMPVVDDFDYRWIDFYPHRKPQSYYRRGTCTQ